MKLEYLISTKEQLDYFEAKDFEVVGIEKEIKKVSDSDKYILVVSRRSNDESSAKELSKLHSDIMSSQELISLTNESSEYYLNRLYPIVIELELKLRKLLRLVSAINNIQNNDEMTSNIKDIEGITLSKLFEYLFTDVDFNKSVKSLLQNKELKDFKFSKKRYKEIVDALEENTPWNQLLGKRVPSLFENYIEVYKTRNEIAHAHQIDLATFTRHNKILETVIAELDSTILFYETTQERVNVDFNTIMFKTLTNYFEFSKSVEMSNISQSLLNLSLAAGKYSFNNTPLNNSLIETGKYINDILEPIRILSRNTDFLNNFVREIATNADDQTSGSESIPDSTEDNNSD